MGLSELIKLNRFTEIRYLEDLLKRKKILLLNPDCWEDSNDKATIDIYKKATGKRSVYALCMTHRSETSHHWNAFANGSTGCCIEISPRKFFKSLSKIKNLKHGNVRYLPINELSKTSILGEDLPFIKRNPYSHENEYRFILTTSAKQERFFEIPIELNFIRKVTINNKVSQEEFEFIKGRLLKISPELKINRSTLYNNERWINFFKRKFGQE
ncbi:MAG: hypothetical protein JNL60_10210 [Bacteroidia bacterium]|nr:hypothetical protein [Bacteroidia bacterium]